MKKETLKDKIKRIMEEYAEADIERLTRLCELEDKYSAQILAEIKRVVEKELKIHVSWLNTEQKEYATGGKETCETILKSLE